MKLTNMELFTSGLKKPVLVNIGPVANDIQVYIRRVTLAQFDEIQKLLETLDDKKYLESLSEDDKNDTEKMGQLEKENTEKTLDNFAKFFVEVVTDEKGSPAFTTGDISEIKKLLSPVFLREFIEAFMIAQGVGKEEVASIEADFRQQPK